MTEAKGRRMEILFCFNIKALSEWAGKKVDSYNLKFT